MESACRELPWRSAESSVTLCARASDLGHHDGRMRRDDAEYGRVHKAHLPGHREHSRVGAAANASGVGELAGEEPGMSRDDADVPHAAGELSGIRPRRRAGRARGGCAASARRGPWPRAWRRPRRGMRARHRPRARWRQGQRAHEQRETVEALLRDLAGNRVGKRCCRRPLPTRVDEREGMVEPDAPRPSRACLPKSSSVSPGKPTMMSVESAMSGTAARAAAIRRQVLLGRVPAVHRLEHRGPSRAARAGAGTASSPGSRPSRRSCRPRGPSGGSWRTGSAGCLLLPPHASSAAKRGSP